uniref:AB hydrolase-1 domain-containing protein n=1 Tax=Kalanchoe fedtschenkoi TaxID=63787 RepID=A0A7N1A8F5_KALFE
MGVVMKTKSVFFLTGRFINDALSFFVFLLLDFLDFVLCFVFKIIDFIVEAEWKACYCSSGREAITSSGKILLSEKGESKIVCLTSSKLQLEEISDTLYTRPSLLSEVSKLTVNEIKKLKVEKGFVEKQHQYCKTVRHVGTMRSKFTVNSTIVEMLQGKIRREPSRPVHRWSDCDCSVCASWTFSSKDTLFVRSQGPKDPRTAKEDVLFIHGFISSSSFWTETLFPNFSNSVKSTYRLFAVDLLGFGHSPKPADSLYTLREHLDMIERSVLEPHKIKSFHIVAHSLGCILALALAVKHPGAVKSLTLLAPPYFPVPKGEQAAQYVMKQVAPRRIWPPISFGASIACYYEHISRSVCLLVSKNHRLWEFLTKLITRNRIRTFLIEGFFCHTHNAAWHTLHNVIFGSAAKLDGYLDAVRDLKCDVNVIHGSNDELIPIECSHQVKTKIPRARVKVIDKKDHITIVVGRQKAFARELEEMWRNASGGDRKAGC